MTSSFLCLKSVWWQIVYLAQLLLLSFGLGSLTLHLPRLLLVPRFPRFAIGFCIVPFVIALWMLAMLLIAPGASRWWFLLPPQIIALALGLYYGKGALVRFRRFIKYSWRQRRRIWPIFVAYVCALLIIGKLCSILVVNGSTPIFSTDALRYLGYSLKLAQHRSASAITGYQSSENGDAFGDMHGPAWHAYLSHALMNNGRHPPGYPHDQAIGVAFQITIIYMLIAVAALAAVSGSQGTGALALLLLLFVPQCEYISTASSRDGFRVIPIVLLAALLSGMSAQRMRRRFHLAPLLPLALMAGFALIGHSLGLAVSVSIGIAWAIWAFAEKASWKHVLSVGIAIMAGLTLAGPQYFAAFLEIRSLPEPDVFQKIALAGTPMLEHWNAWMTSRLQGADSIFQRLQALLARDHYRLSVLGVLFGLAATALWPVLRKRRQSSIISLLGLITLITALPFTGLLNIGFDLSAWFIRNKRYAMQWYPFAAVCVVMLLIDVFNRITLAGGRRRRLTTQVVFCLVILMAFSTSRAVIATQWRVNRNVEMSSAWQRIRQIVTAQQQLSPGKKMLLDSKSYNYYLNNQAIVMYTPITYPVLHAKDEHAVMQALQLLNIGAVYLDMAPYTGYWKDTPLYSFLSNLEKARPISVGSPYLLKDEWDKNYKVIDRIVFPITGPQQPASCAMLVKNGPLTCGWFNQGWRGEITLQACGEQTNILCLEAGRPGPDVGESCRHVLFLRPDLTGSDSLPVVSGSKIVELICELRSTISDKPGILLLRFDAMTATGRQYRVSTQAVSNLKENWERFVLPMIIEDDLSAITPFFVWYPEVEGATLNIRAPCLQWVGLREAQ